MVCFCIFSANTFADSVFSGPYIGLDLGYASSTDEAYQINPPSTEPNGEIWKTKPKGALLGLSVGYNKVYDNNLLLGINLNIDGRSVKNTSVPYVYGVPSVNFPIETKSKLALSVMPKLGYLVDGGSTLIFITAGYQIAKIERKFTNNDWNNGASDSSSAWQGGWAAGLGLEKIIHKNITANIEYRYANLGNYDFKVGALNNEPLGTWVNKQSYKEQSVRLGLNYHF